MATTFRKLIVGVALAASGLSSPVAASERHDAEPEGRSKTLSMVFSAWRARQERVKSFHFTWDLRIVLPKGAYAFPSWRRGLAGLRTGGLDFEGAKHLDVTFPQSEWWGEGADRLRSDFGEFEYSDASGWKEKARFRLTHDGSHNSRLHVPAAPSEAPTIAIWRQVPVRNPSNRSTSGDFLLKDREIDLGPLRLALRPFGPTAECSPEDCRLINENASFGNVRCVTIQMDKLDHSERWWVDPAHDFSVVRCERRQPNCPPLDVTIEVKQGSDGEWVPSRWSWQLAQEEAGRPAILEATVTRCTINAELPAATFAPVGPPGTRVFDATVDVPIYESDDQTGMQPPEKARAALAAIADAWLRRQSKIKSFKFNWERERIPLDGDTFRKTIHTLCVDGEKFATEDDTPGWVAPSPLQPSKRLHRFEKQFWRVHRSKTAFDGVTKRSLSFSDNPRIAALLAIGTGPQGHNDEGPGNRVVMLVFRPLHPIFGPFNPNQVRDPAMFRVLTAPGRIGDVACVIIEHEPYVGQHESYWLDPARDYLPLRKHQTLNGVDTGRVDISYRLDGTNGWIPVEWKESAIGMGGQLFSPHTDTVKLFTVNEPIPAAEFNIETPPRAQVNDMRIDRRSPRQRVADARHQAKVDAIMKARELKRKSKLAPKPRPVYDPFADAVTDVEAALKVARETKKRVLIEFGANWCPGCRDLGVLLKENVELSAALKKGYVLVLVDTDYDSGKKIDQKYVPSGQRNGIPHLAVLDSTGDVLINSSTSSLAEGDDFDIGKVAAFLATWSP